MYVTAFETTEQRILDRISDVTAALARLDVAIIECADLIQPNANAIVLETQAFIATVGALKPRAVFLYQGTRDLDALITSDVADAFPDNDNNTALVQAFIQKEAALIAQAKAACVDSVYAEFLFASEGVFISSGVISSAHLRLSAALSTFCEGTSEEQEAVEHEETIRTEVVLNRLADDIAQDPAFIALRGRRKRAVHVQARYAQAIPESGRLDRADQNPDLMDANVISVTRRAADRCELNAMRAQFEKTAMITGLTSLRITGPVKPQ